MSAAALERAARDGHLPALIRDLQDGSSTERLLARALRRDLALLIERPELLFPCAWRTLHPYREQDAALRSILTDWECGHGRPWLKSLRPPQIPLHSGLLGEYRGGQGTPAFSEDGAVVGYVGGMAWEMATGRPASASKLAAPRAIEPVRGPRDWGRLSFRHEGRLHDLRVDDDTSFQILREGPDRTVLAGGWFGDYEGKVVRVALDSHEILWQTELGWDVDGLYVGPGLVAVSCGQQVVMLDLETGHRVEMGFLPSGTCAWSADGRLLAVGRAGALQVWELERLCEAPLDRPRGRRGWISAEFSIDGRRLMTDSLLCDALTGRILAELDVDGPGYLEGGPPREGRRVLPDGFVEARPFDLRRWDDTGKLVLCARDRHYSGRHELHFSDDGACYGVRERGADVVSVFRTLDGAELGHFSFPAEQDFQVTTDGQVQPRAEPPVGPLRPRPLPPGLFALEDSAGELVAAIPADGPLVGSPDGLRWAGRTEHYALEGFTAASP